MDGQQTARHRSIDRVADCACNRHRVRDLMGKNCSRRIDRALEGKTNNERQLVIGRSDRVHYALGLLSVEEDFENLDLDNNESPTGS